MAPSPLPPTSPHTVLAHARLSSSQPSARRVIPIAMLVCGLLASLIYASFPHPPARSASPLATPPPVATPASTTVPSASSSKPQRPADAR